MDPRDRRRHPRVRIDRACKLLEPRSGRFVAAVACDVSAGGVLVEASRSLRCRPGERLLVAVPAGTDAMVRRSAMVPSRVVRVTRRTGSVRIAMAFEDAKPGIPV